MFPIYGSHLNLLFFTQNVLIVLGTVGATIYRKYSNWLLPSLQQERKH